MGKLENIDYLQNLKNATTEVYFSLSYRIMWFHLSKMVIS